MVQTHFVVGIEYGAEANLVFEMECSDSNDKSSVETKLKAKLVALGKAELGGTVGTSIDDDDKRIRVTYVGDVKLACVPTTLAEVRCSSGVVGRQ